MERYLRVNLLGPGPRLMKKEFKGPRSHKVWETLIYMSTRNNHRRMTSTPLAGFEPAISAGERPQIYIFDSAATETGLQKSMVLMSILRHRTVLWQRQLVVFRVATVQFGKFSGGNCRLQLLKRGVISNTAGTKHAKVTSPVVCIKFAVPGGETQSTV